MIQNLSKTNFEQTIKDNEVVLVDFFADWCGPCKALHPALAELATEYEGKAVISKINVDTSPELAQQFSVRSIPALFYFVFIANSSFFLSFGFHFYFYWIYGFYRRN